MERAGVVPTEKSLLHAGNGAANQISRTRPWQRPLRICAFAACPFPANHGTPGSIREMLEGVAELGHEVHVVTYHFGENIELKGVQLHRIPRWTNEATVVVGPTSRRPLYDALMVTTGLGVIRRYRPHVLHAHGYEAALAASLCRIATGVPVVYSGHNTMIDELPTYGFIRPRWLAKLLARGLDDWVPRLGDRCIPHSTNVERFLWEKGLADRCEPVVNFGIDVEVMSRGNGRIIRQRHGWGERPIVLYAGVLDEFQRLDLLAAAMKQVVFERPDALLVIVTTIPHVGHLDRLRRQAADAGIAEHLFITEPQPLSAVPDYLAACDVAVVPRPQAPGFPTKLLNYMAASRACVLFASSASTGLVHGDNVYLARPDDASALAEGVAAVLGDEVLRERLSLSGHQFVRHHHGRLGTAEKLCQAYRHTAAVKRSDWWPATRGKSPNVPTSKRRLEPVAAG
jgi:glycosyltransferase involved in cell wall biosynthesis